MDSGACFNRRASLARRGSSAARSAQRLDGAFEGFRTAVNQGPVPMHELLRTELRNIRVERSSKKETCFWCNSRK